MLQGLALRLVDGRAKGQSDWELDSTKGSMQLIRIRRSKWDAWDDMTHTVMLTPKDAAIDCFGPNVLDLQAGWSGPISSVA